MMLNRVVLPAPFGPMMEKTDARRDRQAHVFERMHAAEGDRQVFGREDGHARLAASTVMPACCQSRSPRVGTIPARRKIMTAMTMRPSTMCS